MKFNRLPFLTALVLGLAAFSQPASAQSTAFTYQGRLNTNGVAATGNFDVRFGLFSASTGGSPVTALETNSTVAVSGGLFTTTLDFGDIFSGTNYFLEIGVRAAGSSGAFTTLTPRQALTPAPYALYAPVAGGINGVLSTNNLPPNIALLNNPNFTGTITGTSLNLGSNSLIAPLTVTPRLPTSAIGSVATGAQPLSLAVMGRYVGIVDANGNALQIVDASNPTNPVVIGSATTGAFPVSLAVAGRFVYVVNYTASTLQVFDISNPASPLAVGAVATGTQPYSVAVSGRYVYVANFGAGTLQVFDVQNPARPVSVGSVTTGAGPISVALEGRYAYIGNFTASTLQIFDVNNPASPTLTGTVTTGSGPSGVAVTGRYAIVAGTNSLQIFDVKNPAAPVLAGSIAAVGGPRFAALAGRYVYVANEGGTTNGLQLFDISNPAAPVLLGSTTTGNSPAGVAVSGRYAYVVDYNSNLLQIFDLGGAFLQQLEAGSIETGTLQIRDSATVGNSLNVRGGFTAAGSARISGGLSVDNGKITGDGSGLSNLVFTTTTSTAITNFTGPLVGDVTGTQSATVVSAVGGVGAATIASGVNAANAATSANTPGTIVSRDGNGGFSAGNISGSFNGSFNGDGSGLFNLNANALNGTIPSFSIGNGSINNNQLANNSIFVNTGNGLTGGGQVALGDSVTVGTTATSANIPDAIVSRDDNGNFSAGTVSGSFNGDGSGLVNLNAVNLAGTLPNAALSGTYSNALSLTNTTNLIAGTFTGNGAGLTNISASITSGIATNFIGTLAGDVTGTQKATVVSSVGGTSAANVASGAGRANAATSLNSPNTIVTRDASGNFSAGTVTGSFSGNGSGLANLNAGNLTGAIGNGQLANSSIAVNAANGVTGGGTVALGGSVTLSTTATSANTANAIVSRDATGSFSAGNISGNFNGNGAGLTGLNAASLTGTLPNSALSGTYSNAVSLTNSTNLIAGTFTGNGAGLTNVSASGTATNFSGTLAGDVTGTQKATVVSTVGGTSAANVAANVTRVNAATSANTPNTLVTRDATGSFSAGTVTGSFSGNGSGLVNLNVGNLTGTIGNGQLANNSITVSTANGVTGGGTVALGGSVVLSTTATSVNTANAIVSRDATGSFSAGNISGTFNGSGTGLTGLNASSLVGTLPNSALSGTYSNALSLTNTTNIVVGSFTGNGGGVTNLNATNLTGFVPKGGLSGVYSNALSLTNTTNVFVGTFTGNGAGLTNVTTSSSAVTATNFSGALAGDVTGTQGATVVAKVGGVTAANVASGANAANAASSAGLQNTIVKLDANGSFGANQITGSFVGNGIGLVNLNAPNIVGTIANGQLANSSFTISTTSGILGGGNLILGGSVTLGTTATSANTPNAIVSRDATGSFSAGNVSGTFNGSGAGLTGLNAFSLTGTLPNSVLSGTYSNAVSLTNTTNIIAGTFTGNGAGLTNVSASITSGIATNFIGTLAGDVIGTQTATVVSKVGGVTAANVATGANAANAATSSTAPSTIVLRDVNGSFSATSITGSFVGNGAGLANVTAGSATNFSGSLAGDVTGTQTATVVSKVGGATAASVATAVTEISSATSASTPSSIVLRDATGSFSAGTVTASFIGNAGGLTNLNATNLIGSLPKGALSGVYSNALSLTNTTNLIAGTFTGSGAGLTGLSAANLTGTIPSASIAAGSIVNTELANSAITVSPGNGLTGGGIVALGGTTTLSTTATPNNIPSAIVSRDASGNFTAGTITGTFAGNGGGIVGLNAGSLVGSLPGGALSGTYFNALSLTNTTNVIVGTFSGNGAGLTNLPTVNNVANATNFSSALAGDVTGTQGATVVGKVGGVTAANVAAGANAANAATSSLVPSTIVLRDGNGSFSATTITGSFVGNGAGLANVTANTATNFSGTLAGDVTGTQGATVVSKVGGVPAANVTSAVAEISSATTAATPATIVLRDAAGGFSAAAITASFTGNGGGLTNLNATNLIGFVPKGGLSGVYSNALSLTNTTNLIVGTFTGNGAGLTNVTTSGTAGTATNFSGALAGDVTGTQAATVVGHIGGVTAANVASGANAANAATSANTPLTIVTRDGTGSFSAGTISGTFNGNGAGLTGLNVSTNTAANFSGALTGDVTGTQGTTVVSKVGGVPAANVTSAVAEISSATTAATPATIVLRDAAGGFSAAAITASFTGNGGGLTNLNATNLIGSIPAGALSGTYSNAVALTNTANLVFGKFMGDGANLTNLNIAAGTVANFTGALAGDVSGTQGATVVGKVGGVTAANVASGANAANAATSANTPLTIVSRDASGNFTAGTITGSFSGNGAGLTGVTTAANFSGTLAGDVIGNQFATTVNKVGGVPAPAVASAVSEISTATAAAIPATIVMRDAAGNINASFTGDGSKLTSLNATNLIGSIPAGALSGTYSNALALTNTANLIFGKFMGDGANLTNLQTVNNATTAINFSGALSGDVSGTQGATVVSKVGGVTAANLASGANAANAASSLNTPSTIVTRDATGSFSAGNITGTFTGNGAGLANLNAANLSGTIPNTTIGAASISNLQLANSAITLAAGTGIAGGGTVALGGTLTLNTTATAANNAGTIVSRDGTGSFAANSITLNGNLNLPATTATSGIIFSGGAPVFQTFGSANTFAGNGAGNLTLSGMQNAAFGFESLQVVTTGNFNTAVGALALESDTTGRDNTAEGAGALRQNVSGLGNTAVGAATATGITTGANNTAVGFGSMQSGNGNVNTAVGANSLFVTTGDGNTAVGFQAGVNNTGGGNNIFLGSNAGDTADPNASGQFIAGSQGGPITSIFFGSGVTSAFPQSSTINGTGGSGTDTSGANLNLAGGISTGVGTGGSVIFLTSPQAPITGTNANPLTERMRITGLGNVGIGKPNPATTLDVNGTVTALAFVGDGSGLTNLSGGSSGTATNFSGFLAGDVIGTQSATTVAFVGGLPAADVATGANDAENATSGNEFNSIVKRADDGSFSAGTITASFVGDGSGLTGVNAATFNGPLASSSLSGSYSNAVQLLNPLNTYAGTFTGTVSQNGVSLGSGSVAPLTSAPDATSAAIGTITTGPGSSGVAVSGRYAYVVNQHVDSLQVFDVSVPSAPKLIGSAETPGDPVAVAVSGDFAYVLTTSFNLEVYRVSNPAQPAAVGSIPIGGGGLAKTLSLSGHYAYVGGGNAADAGLFIVDITSLVARAVPGFAGFGSGNGYVAQSGLSAYAVSDEGNGLAIFDVSNPISPIARGSAPTGNSPDSIAVSGRYAYVANNSDNNLEIFDVSNQSAPVAVSTNVTTGHPRSVTVADRYAYVVGDDLGDGNGFFQIFDISNPLAPVSLGSRTVFSQPDSVVVDGRYAFLVSSNDSEMEIFDLGGAYLQQVEAGSIEAANLQTRDNVQVGNNLDVRGGLAAGTGRFSGDVGVAGNLEVLGTISGNLNPNSLQGVDNSPVQFTSPGNVFVGDGGGLTNLNATAMNAVNFTGQLLGDVTGVQSATTINTVGGVSAAQVAASVNAVLNASSENQSGAIVQRDEGGSFSAGTINAIFSGDGSQLINLPASSLTGTLPDMVLSGTYSQPVQFTNTSNVYAGNFTGTIVPSGVTLGSGSVMAPLTVNPNATSGPIATVGTGAGPASLAVFGKYVYVGNVGDDSLQIFDVTTPATPQVITSQEIPVVPNVLAADGQFVYVVDNNLRMSAIDVDNPARPEAFSPTQLNPTGFPTSLTVAGHYAYVGGNDGEANFIYTVDLDNQGLLFLVSSTSFGSTESILAQSGRSLFAVDPGDGSLGVVDVTDPVFPNVESTTPVGAAPSAVAVSGRYAYITTSTNLEIVDISNPAMPVIVSTNVTTGNPISVTVAGHYAYVLGSDTGDSNGFLQIFDVSNPITPVSLGNRVTIASPTTMVVSGRYAFLVSSNDNQLEIFDLGGAYLQQVEAGTVQAGTLQTSDSVMVGNNLMVRGGFNAGDGRFTGNLAVHGSIQVDGDINTGTINASIINGNLNAANIDIGTLPAAALSGNYTNPIQFSSTSNAFAGDGSGLTGLNAGNLTGAINPAVIPNGSISPSKLSANSFTINVGQGLGGGGTVPLGGTITIGSSVTTNDLPVSVVSRDGTGDFSASGIVGNLVNGLNTSGGNITLAGGPGTGTGAGGAVILTTTAAGGTSSPVPNPQTERMRITTAGLVGIGISSPTFTLQVNGSVAGVGAYNNVSDERYKQNITPLTNALDKIMEIDGVTYDWRTNEFPQIRFDSGTQIGFIAQQLKNVLPEAVTRDNAGYYSIAYSEVIPVLVEAVKDQQKEIASKDAELQEMRQHDAAVEARLTALENALKQVTENRH